MGEWKRVKLGEICSRVCSGGTPRSNVAEYYDGGSIPWLNTKEVTFGRIYSTEKCITESGLENSSAKWIEANTVVVAMYGATAGNVAITRIPLTTNQACCNLQINPQKADADFVFYYLKWQYHDLCLLANGAAQQNLNAQVIKDFQIVLPDLPTQRRIAAVLGALDDKIEVNRKICENLEAQAQALFKAWFVDAVSPMMPLSEICKSITDGVHNTVSDVPRTDWRLLSCKNLRNGEIDFEQGYRTISNETFNTLRARTHLDRGDVLVGSVGTIGEIALVCEEPTNYEFQRSVAILKPDLDVISSAYLYCAMRAAKERLMILSHGAVQQCIFLNDFRGFTIQVGSKELIDQFSNIVTPLLTKKHMLISESRALAVMRDALLPKLMSGELAVEKVEG